MYETNYDHLTTEENEKIHCLRILEWQDPDDAHANPNRKGVLVFVDDETITLDFSYGSIITHTLSMTVSEWYLFSMLVKGMTEVTDNPVVGEHYA